MGVKVDEATVFRLLSMLTYTDVIQHSLRGESGVYHEYLYCLTSFLPHYTPGSVDKDDTDELLLW